ncbi:MAG: DUF3833 domain-containing protein [Pseudomonadota bacterium]|nr:hypothetical protein [Sphingomonas sp.]MDQ3471826.1 DUF3833 domain-containing protein [Pseudomonadota bacterium]
MASLRFAVIASALAAAHATPATAERIQDPLRFFEGRTETVSSVKVVTKKPVRTRSLGRGIIKADGTLDLVQRVEEQGKPARIRRWLIRRVAPGRFTGTMSEATGPVTVEQVGEGYRFRFKMKGNLSVEQWLTPHAGGKSATNKVTVRKLGIKVGSSDGTIRKIG